MLTSSRRLKDRAILDAPTPRNDVGRTIFARMCSLWPLVIESPFGRIDRNRPACGEVVRQSDKPESALSEIRVPVRSILAKLRPGSVCLDSAAWFSLRLSSANGVVPRAAASSPLAAPSGTRYDDFWGRSLNATSRF